MKKEKIGILTLPINNNYGGIIQLIALYHFLEESGFQPVWIDKRQWHNQIKNTAIRLLRNNPFYKIYDPKELRKSKEFLKIISPFLDKYVPIRTSPIYTQEKLKQEISDFNTVIVGSDQVWRLEYVKDNYPTYFLDFLPKGIKKIAYAASFGTDSWEGEVESIEKVKMLLNNFNLITVREGTGVEVCQKTFSIENVHHVLDPCFLPNVNFYLRMLENHNFNEEIELFNYVLDPTLESAELVQNIANQKKLKVHKIYLNESSLSEDSSLVINWLYHFCHAEFIVTDSFHGMVFSIIFKKQFVVVGNRKRGLTRFSSLLKLLDLENRLVENSSNVATSMLSKIDYKAVDEKLDKLRYNSKKLLVDTLLQ